MTGIRRRGGVADPALACACTLVVLTVLGGIAWGTSSYESPDREAPTPALSRSLQSDPFSVSISLTGVSRYPNWEFYSGTVLVVGEELWYNTTENGGTGPFTYQYNSTPVFAGCVATAGPSIVCTPTSTGSFVVGVNVTDADDVTSSASQSATISIDPGEVQIAPSVEYPGSSFTVVESGEVTTFSLTGVSNYDGTSLSYDWSGLPAPCSNENSSTIVCTLSTPPLPDCTGFTDSPQSFFCLPITVNVSINGGNGGYGIAYPPWSSGAAQSSVVGEIPGVTFTPRISPTTGIIAARTNVSFDALPISGGLAPYHPQWSFGDHDSSPESETNHTYAWIGSYAAVFSVADSLGFWFYWSHIVTVNPNATLSANPSAVVVGTPTNLVTGWPQGGFNSSVVLSYDYVGLPNGCATSNTSTLECTPTTPGTYTVRVFENSSWGISSNATTTLTVSLYPISFEASPSAVDVGIATSFSVSVTGGSGTLSYHYTGLPPGCTTSDTATLSCTPTAPGTYAVRVYVNDTAGNSNSTVTDLTVNALPSVSPSATPSPTDVLTPVTFTASVSGGTGPFQYTWLLPYGDIWNHQTAYYTFNSPGNYTVRVYANDTFGRSATRTLMITVYPQLAATLVVSNSTPLLGQTVAFVTNATGGLGPYNYTYLGFPPGCVSEDRAAIGCLPTQSDYYNVTVHVADQSGGSVDANASIHVIFDFNVIVPTTTSAGSPFTISVDTNETFSGGTALVPALGFGAFTYTYTGLPPGCLSQDAASITCTPTQVGTYHITVSVHDQVGDHQTHTVVVNVVPAKSPGFNLGTLFSGTTGYALIGGIAVIVAVALLAFRARRKRKGTETPAAASPAPGPPSPPT